MPILENVKLHILNPIIGLLFVLALVLFLYGWVEYLYQGKVGENRDQAIKSLIWGTVGMTIMLSVYGIMTIITETIKSLGS
jgi:hypothetical protein